MIVTANVCDGIIYVYNILMACKILQPAIQGIQHRQRFTETWEIALNKFEPKMKV